VLILLVMLRLMDMVWVLVMCVLEVMLPLRLMLLGMVWVTVLQTLAGTGGLGLEGKGWSSPSQARARS
jgi:hypothetical protein